MLADREHIYIWDCEGQRVMGPCTYIYSSRRCLAGSSGRLVVAWTRQYVGDRPPDQNMHNKAGLGLQTISSFFGGSYYFQTHVHTYPAKSIIRLSWHPAFGAILPVHACMYSHKKTPRNVYSSRLKSLINSADEATI